MGDDDNYQYDYATLDYPEPEYDEDAMSDWSYVQRRAFLHDELREAQHPRNLDYTQAEYGEMFGVGQRQISKDFAKLREYRQGILGRHATTSTEMLAEEAVAELREDGEWREAWATQKEYVEWLFDMGELDKEPDKLEVDLDPEEAYLSMLRQTAEDEQEQGDADD